MFQVDYALHKMDGIFEVFIHRIKDGHQEKIDENLSPAFLKFHEAGLVFNNPISICLIVELVEDNLILRLNFIETEATMRCMICDREVKIKILIKDVWHTEPISNIKRGVFNFREILREEILLAIPLKPECNDGNCPERQALEKYFLNKKKKESYPFEDL